MEESHDLTLLHAKALAMSAIDIYNDPSILEKIKDNFDAQIAKEYQWEQKHFTSFFFLIHTR